MRTPVCRSVEETGRLGDEIYERDIRPQVEESHHGKIVAIDVDSGDYAIGDSVIAAAKSLRSQRPDADIPGDDVWIMRIGYRAVYSFAGGNPRRVE